MKKSPGVIKIENFLIISLAITAGMVFALMFGAGIPIKSAICARNAVRNYKSRFSTAYAACYNECILMLSNAVVGSLDDLQDQLNRRLTQNQK